MRIKEHYLLRKWVTLIRTAFRGKSETKVSSELDSLWWGWFLDSCLSTNPHVFESQLLLLSNILTLFWITFDTILFEVLLK